MKPGKILLTVAYLDGFHGSVMHVAEISSFLESEGWNVSVASIFIDLDKIRGLFNDRILLKSILEVKNEEFDVIWAHHFPLVGALFANGVKCRKLIYGCLSGSAKLETPPIFWKSCSVIHAISYECASKLSEDYSIPLKKFSIVENLLPEDFVSLRGTTAKSLRKIAVVSNHPPEEIRLLRPFFRGRGIDVQFIGEKKQKRIVPDFLSEFDLVITIGKTVQYALGLGIPVFLYDHFGGNGYVTVKNFEKERRYNFSGRPDCRKLKTEEICREIIDNYSLVVTEIDKLKILAVQNFLLSKRVDSFLEIVERSPCVDLEGILEHKLYNQQCLEVCRRLSGEKRRRKKKRGAWGSFLSLFSRR